MSRRIKSPTYNSWSGAKGRCRSTTDPRWNSYGGRGITFSERWDLFANFLADMGERPAGTTLDRIDNDKGYEPGNCRWATRSEQQRNKRDRKRYLHEGKMMSLVELVEATGLGFETLRGRIKKKRVPKGQLVTIEPSDLQPWPTRARPGPRRDWFAVISQTPSNKQAAEILGASLRAVDYWRRRYVRNPSNGGGAP